MKKVSLNHYLSISNPWTRRIIGIESFSKKRDIEQIEREYNQDKYGKLVEFDFDNIEIYKKKEFEFSGIDRDSPITISFDEELFQTSIKFARSLQSSIVSNTIERYNPNRICELGCGYGYNLSYLQKEFPEVYGGEYSINAVELGTKLGFDLKRFNYYDLDDYNIIREGSLILTSHSIEQIPSAKNFISGVEKHRQKIDVVVHFEPCLLETRSSLLGCFRNQYIKLNDYNTDLVKILHERDDIEILEYQPDFMGINPLNSTHLIVWKFK